MSSDDAALLESIAAGDESALAALYRAYEPRVYAFALSRLNDPAGAADVLNEVMLEVWRNAYRFEGRSRVSSWVLGIARHKILDQLRKRGARVFEEVDPELPSDPEGASVEDTLAGVRDAEHLRTCIGRLPAAQQEAVHLAFFEDLGYAEIARIMECPEGTVKTRIFHAKRALKRCLAGLLHRGADDA